MRCQDLTDLLYTILSLFLSHRQTAILKVIKMTPSKLSLSLSLSLPLSHHHELIPLCFTGKCIVVVSLKMDTQTHELIYQSPYWVTCLFSLPLFCQSNPLSHSLTLTLSLCLSLPASLVTLSSRYCNRVPQG